MKKIAIVTPSLCLLFALNLYAQEDKTLPEQAGERAKLNTKKIKMGEDVIDFKLNQREFKRREGVFIKKEEKAEEIIGRPVKKETEVKAYVSKKGRFAVKATNVGIREREASESSYDGKLEFFDEFGKKLWEIEKPGMLLKRSNVSNDGKFVIVDAEDGNFIEYLEVYNINGELIYKKNEKELRVRDKTISPSGKAIFVRGENQITEENELIYINFETGEEWKNEPLGYILSISESDRYFITLCEEGLCLYENNGTLMWKKPNEKNVKCEFSKDEKDLICGPSSFIPPDDKIYVIDARDGKTKLTVEKVELDDNDQKVIVKPTLMTSVSISPDKKYIAIGTETFGGFGGHVYVCILDLKGKLLWFKKIDIEVNYIAALPRFSDDGNYLIVDLPDQGFSERVFDIKNILK